jgi:hypothetical protein
VLREYDVECTMHAALENALDVPHTAFVHRGDFRGKESREIEAVRRRIPGGIEVEYIGEPPLSGPTTDAAGTPIVSQHWDRFFLPGIAQVEYRTSSGRHQISTLPHTPVSALRTRFWLVSCWKVPAARRAEMAPIIEKQLDTILGQDVEILRQQTRRIRELGGESYRSTPLDLMGPEILRMLRCAEQGTPPDDHPIDRSFRLRVFESARFGRRVLRETGRSGAFSSLCAPRDSCRCIREMERWVSTAASSACRTSVRTATARVQRRCRPACRSTVVHVAVN